MSSQVSPSAAPSRTKLTDITTVPRRRRMSSKTANSSSSGARKTASTASPASNSRRGSATTVPKASAASAAATARPASPAAAASGIATPPSSSSFTNAPLPDLTSLLNLPLRVVVAASGELPQREIEATLWTYDPQTSFVVLTSPATSSLSSSSQPQTAQNPPSTKRNYHLIKSTQIKSVQVLSLVPDASIPSPASQLRSINPAELSARVEKAVQEDQKARARVGQGVSDEAQALFDALGKTLPVRWAGRSIVVMDEVIIGEPYGVADVKGGKGAGGYVERVKKVVSAELLSRGAVR